MLKRAQNWFRKLAGKDADQPDNSKYEVPPEQLKPCCDQTAVHIAYRGKSDERLYLAENRTWEETRYFDQKGLRVFCAKCRRRLL